MFTMTQLVDEIGDPVSGIQLSADKIDFDTKDFTVNTNKMNLKDSTGTVLSFADGVTTIMGNTLAVDTANGVQFKTGGETYGTLSFKDNALDLNTTGVTFSKTNSDGTTTTYASFSDAVSSIVGDLDVTGDVTAKALKTPITTTNASTYIENGVCRFIAPGISNAQINSKEVNASYIEIGCDNESGDMVLKFYSNGECLYNLGPAGFKKV